MSKGINQKLKLLYLMKIFLEYTDESHYITMVEIIRELEKYNISAGRKSIYSDIQYLCEFGICIEGIKKGREYYYYVKKREFELAELKLLVDAIQAAKFITRHKSNELIHKIEMLASKYQATELQRQVVVANRAKTMNEEIFHNIDKIHMAINNNYAITFQYYDWNREKKIELRHEGGRYLVSPYALVWEDENYYLIGYDILSQMKRHYRVDRMLYLEISNQKRLGKELFSDFNLATYSNQVFGMYGGEEEIVKLQFENRFANIVIDKFGRETSMIPVEGTHFRINVKVLVSNQFFGWIFALGNGVTILGPESVLDKIKNEVEDMYSKYC